MEPLQTWWATELYPSKDEDTFGVAGDFEVVRATDAQAAIAALQARVKELEGRLNLNGQIDVGAWIADLQAQLTQRTAELEAAKAIQAIDLKNNNAYREQVANLQAELERVRGELAETKEEVKCLDEQVSALNQGCLEYERLIAALPKVEGEITEATSDHGGEIRDGNGYVHYYATSRAKVRALLQVLQHRQGMEGVNES